MEIKVGKFSFVVPTEGGHADAGKKIEKPFEYEVLHTESEAKAKMEEKKWSLVDMVNDILKQNARSNAYQAALLPYRPSEVPAEDIQERLVRDYIRLGIPEEQARAQVTSMLANRATA